MGWFYRIWHLNVSPLLDHTTSPLRCSCFRNKDLLETQFSSSETLGLSKWTKLQPVVAVMASSLLCLKLSSWPIDLMPHSCFLLIKERRKKGEQGEKREKIRGLEGWAEEKWRDVFEEEWEERNEGWCSMQGLID